MKNSTKLSLLRIFHIFLIILFLISIIIIYYSVFTGYKGDLLTYGIILLLVEGLGLIIWRECPLAPLHRKLGDFKYIWKLFFSDKLAIYVIPALAIISIIGLLLLLIF